MAIDDQEAARQQKRKKERKKKVTNYIHTLSTHESSNLFSEWIYTHDIVSYRPEVKPHVCAICSWYDDDVSESFYRNA